MAKYFNELKKADYFIDDGWVRLCDQPPHGSPADRGSADRYYGRPCRPHYYPDGTYKGQRIELPFMTQQQVEEYTDAWEKEEGRKDYVESYTSTHIECDTTTEEN